MNKKSRVGIIVAVVVAAWLAYSIVVYESHDDSLSSSTFGAPTAHDATALAEINVQLAAFNTAALPLMTEYSDPSVSARKWVKSANGHLIDMQAAQDSIQSTALTLENAHVRDAVMAFVGGAERQLDAVRELVDAVDRLDVKAERAAQRRLTAATAERAELAQELVAILLEVEGAEQSP